MKKMATEEPEGELPTEVVRLLFEGVAPERTADFERFFSTHRPQLIYEQR
jgi:hypothetical protein